MSAHSSSPVVPGLVFERLGVRYPGARGEAALQDVNLHAEPGSLVVAIGQSGCGKTTLLNVAAGFVSPTSGRALLDGQPILGPSAERSVVFQEDALLPWLNVLDNVALGLRLRGLGKAERDARARAVLAQVDLQGAERKFIWELSGGMRQRVGLARALATDARVLLLDEPFAALDAFTREQMQELLLRLWRADAQHANRQVLLITHDIEEAVFLASELVLLSPGPGRIVERITLDFGRRYIAGEATRSIKSDPAFIAMREHVLDRVFAQRGASSAALVTHGAQA
ncbi:taurine ABC transporter ATP-binding subunit [Uliginosibacterium sp. H1]|uniref:taurine ABC transporter ATP-binding subunit n=1 Tax=Uliginosibacterium sp. H1 TaxID=3114757 RepID=UPI002E16C4D0|nr:taurine ABC transporter ATP-binding subunit [Uliginosibacterium sp. H1]